MNLFYELHSDLPREGPGCNSSTRQAFEALPNVPIGARILDIGCGPGVQTMLLASLISQFDGTVIATDVNQKYLDELQRKVENSALANVLPEIADMCDLHYERSSFDIIWAEGAIFIIGFECGLRQWNKLLKPNGCIVVSELSWLTNDPPDEVRAFWSVGYPDMKTVEENIAVAEAGGFELIKSFTLPESGWYDDYYDPMERKARELIEKYASEPNVASQLQNFTSEISMYQKYSNYYGYQFYILQNKAYSKNI